MRLAGAVVGQQLGSNLHGGSSSANGQMGPAARCSHRSWRCQMR